jgi:hypothetical protein
MSSGIVRSTIIRDGFPKGDASCFIKNGRLIGLRYWMGFPEKKHLGLETGLNYLFATLKIEPAFTGEPVAVREEDFSVVSVPLYVNLSFWKYFYFNSGVIIDYQHCTDYEYTKFGFGYGLGLGIKYNYKNFFIYMNPKIERHLFLSKTKGLIESGVIGGIGYSF